MSSAVESLRLFSENPLLLVPLANVQAKAQKFDQAALNAKEALSLLDRFDRQSGQAAGTAGRRHLHELPSDRRYTGSTARQAAFGFPAGRPFERHGRDLQNSAQTRRRGIGSARTSLLDAVEQMLSPDRRPAQLPDLPQTACHPAAGQSRRILSKQVPGVPPAQRLQTAACAACAVGRQLRKLSYAEAGCRSHLACGADQSQNRCQTGGSASGRRFRTEDARSGRSDSSESFVKKYRVPELTLLRSYGELREKQPAYQQRYLNLLERLGRSQPDLPLVQAALGRKLLRAGDRIDQSQDRLHVFELCAACVSKMRMFGTAELAEDSDFYII